MQLYHDSRDTKYRAPFGAVETGTEVMLSVQIRYDEGESEDVDRIILRLWIHQGEMRVDMEKSVGNVYRARIQMPEKGCLVWYYFIAENPAGRVYYGNNADHLGGVGMMYDHEPPSFQITCYRFAEVPKWYKDGIVYQIFPDRFARDENWRARCQAVINEEAGARGRRETTDGETEHAGQRETADGETEYAGQRETTDGETEYAGQRKTTDGETGYAGQREVTDAKVSCAGQRKFIEEDWYKPAYYIKDKDGNVTDWPFYGGSFKGIASKLGYLKMLGVSVIYLNPIFKASSNHRYDTGNYMEVDPMLGTMEDFEELIQKAEEAGIRIILDGVFSHTGADSLYFDKYGNYGGRGAYGNPDSPYRKWFDFGDSYECGYRAWWGVSDLPEVNECEPGFVEMICGEEGVLGKWLRDGVSGWRLDVADELPDEFIKAIRSRIKAENQEALLLGEVWEDASNKESYGVSREYFLGEELDSTMHYPLRSILVEYALGNMNAADVERRILSLKENYPRENLYGALNLIGSHDRKRILSVMGVDENYDLAAARVKLISALQYTLPGVPCIYYGDEAGMFGNSDPENRSGFIWDRENPDLQYHFRSLGVIYEEHSVLKEGELRFLEGVSGEPGVLAFVREYVPEHAGYGADCSKDVSNALEHGPDVSECAGHGDDRSEDILGKTGYGQDSLEREADKILVIANRSEKWVEISLGEVLQDACYGLELFRSEEIRSEVLAGKENLVLEPVSVKIILLKAYKPECYSRSPSAGVLCHISSIPGRTLGAPARRFVDYLSSSGMKLWQILPLNPPGLGNSPYCSHGAFAGNTELIDWDELPDVKAHDGLRGDKAECSGKYERSCKGHDGLQIDKAECSGKLDRSREKYDRFCEDNREWLIDYVAYIALREHFGNVQWTEWPEDAPGCGAEVAVSAYGTKAVLERMQELTMEQYYFACQWDALLAYAHQKGVEIIGDLPIFVSLDSADAWACRDVFLMDDKGRLTCHAGVPGDYFSPEGQDWGNPLYDWQYLRKTGYDWWVRRLDQCRKRYDYVRLDHFRSFAEFYAIPQGKKPIEGRWQHGPGLAFFRAVEQRLAASDGKRPLKILAEDLGQLDGGVYNLLKLVGYPGMNIWQFSADEMMGMSEVQSASRVFYTGTHDNQTLLGWWRSHYGEDPEGGTCGEEYFEGESCERDSCEVRSARAVDEIIEKLYQSSVPWVILQLQDMLGLGDEARINVPGTVGENWDWHLKGNTIEEAIPRAGSIAEKYKALAIKAGRDEE